MRAPASLVLLLPLLGCRKSSPCGGEKSVAEVTGRAEALAKCKSLVVRGWVVAGSIRAQVKDGQVLRSFEISQQGARLSVSHRGIVSDLFKGEAEVIVTGRLSLGPPPELAAAADEAGLRTEPPRFP